MFFYTAKFPRRRIRFAAGLLILLMIAALCGKLLTGDDPIDRIPAADDSERTAYLRTLGWEVENTPLDSLSFTLPQPLEEPYVSYNVLQLEQDFDLIPYAGKTVERHVYSITNHPSGLPCQANLYICDGKLIAGDILAVGKGGFIAPLAFPDAA